MRINIYYENRLGRNDGAPLYIWHLLQELPNIEVTHLLPTGNYLKYGKPDANLIIDWGEDAVSSMLSYKPVFPKDEFPKVPLIYFASDTHMGDNAFKFRLEQARRADYVFVAQKPAVEAFKKLGVRATWCPHGVEERAYPNKPIAIKKYDISFVGHLVSGERIEFLDKMFKEFPNFWYGTRISRYIREDKSFIDDPADIYRKTRVVLNPPTKGDVNMRVFEVMATGSFLLTERVPGIEDLYENKKHLVLYDSLAEAIELTKYYLAHEEERNKIALAGMKETLAKHTYKHRILKMLKKLNYKI